MLGFGFLIYVMRSETLSMSVDITKAAEEGNPEAKRRRRYLSFDGLDDGNDREEIDWQLWRAEVEARNNVRGGCFRLELDDLHIEDVVRDFKASADFGDFCGLFAYGDMLLNGLGVDENPEEAARYYKLAADKGDSHGMWRYGKCLQKGLGVDRDVKEAARYYKASADLGNRTGMLLYGKCLRKGEGVEKDEQAGTIYFLRGKTCTDVNAMVLGWP